MSNYVELKDMSDREIVFAISLIGIKIRKNQMQDLMYDDIEPFMFSETWDELYAQIIKPIFPQHLIHIYLCKIREELIDEQERRAE